MNFGVEEELVTISTLSRLWRYCRPISVAFLEKEREKKVCELINIQSRTKQAEEVPNIWKCANKLKQ